ncbi:dapper homolog 2 [Chanos chanos]|uniref:Dapper homolog 2 n=1 Tax=Chanos chanos TaxID=29144 RepID=A0A6J2VAE0_CHACN|nr:dapper homolog 2-like [Chanos chanos]
MMSRKVPGSGQLSATAGIDRGRVGERLHAALAGLQELHFLREKQSSMVHWALRMDRDEPVCSDRVSAAELGMSTEEQRLEATLTALKQQLTRLRRQDIGLKTHLQQLDLQISELKLDVCKASTEHLESDSRPSSGFYELSDAGSGSLSNSCTSVYSECLSSSSQTSLFLPPYPSCLPVNHTRSPPRQADVCRRRSADENTAQSDHPRGLGIRLCSSRTQAGTSNSERARQRPVSTGDLDSVLPPIFGCFKSKDVKTSTLTSNLRDPSVDPKYQSSLVSRGGTEVYHYPSPLHAVALQSPIFTLSGEAMDPVTVETQHQQESTAGHCTPCPKYEPNQTMPACYINKLLQRSASKTSLQMESSRDRAQPSTCLSRSTHPPLGRVTGMDFGKMNVAPGQGPVPPRAGLVVTQPDTGRRPPTVACCPEQTTFISTSLLEDPSPTYHTSNSTAGREHNSVRAMENFGGGVEVKEKERQSVQATQRGGEEFEELASSPKPQEKGPSQGYTSEEGRVKKGCNPQPQQIEFVHAQFVPAGSQQVKVQQADRRTKAVKLKRRSCEKPSGKTSHVKQSLKQKEREFTSKSRGERDIKLSSSGRVRARMTNGFENKKGHSHSESSLYSPLHPSNTCMQPQSQRNQSSRCTTSRRAQYPDPDYSTKLMEQGRKKHSSRKWASTSEILLPPTASTHCLKPKEAPVLRRPGMARNANVRPRSSQWGGSSFPMPRPLLQPSISSSLYFSDLNVRYPAAPLSRYPPRAESEFSEYSAECASLFHSTIAESSEGEMSDYTTNRFGDSESSQDSQTLSDSDSSLSLGEEEEYVEDEEGGLVWAEATLGPTAAGLPLQTHPRIESSACRIKASRALKKKIRRFQPDTLKVMTLV